MFNSRIPTEFVLFGLALALGIGAPFVLDNATLRLMTDAFLLMTAAQLWNLLAGYGGVVSVGQHAFVGAGAYAFFGMAQLGGLSPFTALALTLPLGMALALPIFALIMRLRTAYFAIGSWVVAEVLMLLSGKLTGFGGGAGLSLSPALIKAFGASLPVRVTSIYWLALAVLAVSILLILLLLRSRFGYALQAMRDNEGAAIAFGVNPNRVRAVLFVLSGGLLALVGALNALQKLRINPAASFGLLDWTVYVMFVVVLGGIGRVSGPIIGAVVFLSFRAVFADWGGLYMIALGFCIIVMMILEPRGIAGVISRLRAMMPASVIRA